MKNRSLLKIGLLAAGNFINAALGFSLVVTAARALPLDQFGKYALYASILIGFAKLLDFGTNSIFVSDTQENALKKLVAAKLFLLIAALVLGNLFLILTGISTPLQALAFSLGLVFYLFFYVAYAYEHKNQNFLRLFLVQFFPALTKGFTAFLISTKLFIPTFDSLTLIFSVSVGLSVFFVPKINWKEIINHVKIGKNLISQTYMAGISQMIIEGWPSMTNSVAKFMGNFSSVGVYSAAEKFSDIFSLVSLAVFQVLLPKNAERKAKKHKFDLLETLILSIIVIIGATVASLVSSPILTILFGSKFGDSGAILGIMIFASALFSISGFMESYFFVENETDKILKINLIRLASFLLFGFPLISNFQIQGLALNNLVASILALCATIWFINQHRTRDN